MPYRISLNRHKCIRAGRCEVIAEAIFRLPPNAKAELLAATVEEAEPARSAERECPSGAIRVHEESA